MAALAFQDARTASEFLSCSEARRKRSWRLRSIRPTSRLFAVYHRDRRSAAPRLPCTPRGGRLLASTRTTLSVFRHIVLHEPDRSAPSISTPTYGSGTSGCEPLYRHRRVLMLGSAVLALLVSSRLQRVISGPILGLEADHEKGLRSEELFVAGRPKITERRNRRLIDGFNAMLAEIQQRDTALQRRTRISRHERWNSSGRPPSACGRRTS